MSSVTEQKAIWSATRRQAAGRCCTATLLKTIMPIEQTHQLLMLTMTSAEESLSAFELEPKSVNMTQEHQLKLAAGRTRSINMRIGSVSFEPELPRVQL